MAKIGVGLIGCGGNMRGHIRRLTALPEVEIVGLVEPAAANVQAVREQYPQLAAVPVFDNHPAMLAAVKPDAVEISTPHTLHAQQILDSLDAGCHVLCEKPHDLQHRGGEGGGGARGTDGQDDDGELPASPAGALPLDAAVHRGGRTWAACSS